MSEEQREAEDLFALDSKIRLNEQARRVLMVQNMEALRKVQDKRKFRSLLGDDKAEWPAYLAQIGIYYSRAKVRRWHRILDFLQESGLDNEVIFDVPESRLEQIALRKQSFKDKEHVLEIIESAKTLTPRDWKNTILELQGKPTLDDCKHHFKLYELCPDCGAKHAKE